MTTKTYKCDPVDPNRVLITSDQGNSVLTPAASQRVYNHSPDGFAWGYCGSGPAQLSLALLIDFFDGDDRKAQLYYQDLKERLIAKWPQGEPWEITTDDIEAALANIDEAKLSRHQRGGVSPII